MLWNSQNLNFQNSNKQDTNLRIPNQCCSRICPVNLDSENFNNSGTELELMIEIAVFLPFSTPLEFVNKEANFWTK